MFSRREHVWCDLQQWLACNNVVPTLTLLHHRNIAPSPICARCGLQDETFFHCMRDCRFSKDIWQHIRFNNSCFFAYEDIEVWIKDGMKGPNSTTFVVGLWWVSMSINNEQMSIHRVEANIKNSADNILQAFPLHQAVQMERYIRWNNHNFDCNILNVDGSCLGSPAKVGFGGLIRNNAGYYLTGFSRFLLTSTDILEVELQLFISICQQQKTWDLLL